MTAEKPNVQTSAGQAQLKEMGVKPIPAPDDLTRPYWDAANKGELHIQKCSTCGEHRHPPAAQCPSCYSKQVEWVKLSGKGTVYTFIIDHRLMVPGFDEPYAVIVVNPEEAAKDTVRITGNIRDCDRNDVYIGMPVEVVFEERVDGVKLPQWKPGAGAKLRSKGETPPTIRS
jgi:hypothetical protein